MKQVEETTGDLRSSDRRGLPRQTTPKVRGGETGAERVEVIPSASRPRLVIMKHDRLLEVYDGDELVLTIPVVTGKNPADKVREGDLATPEGEFFICYKNPESKYHRFLGLSYPNREDAERGLREALIDRDQFNQIDAAMARGECPPWKTALGGEVGLHGPCPNVTWTHGCVAMETESIERLYSLLDLGDRVTILP